MDKEEQKTNDKNAETKDDNYKAGYGKKSVGKWIIIYLIAAIIIYGLIYYFANANKNSPYSTNSTSPTNNTNPY